MSQIQKIDTPYAPKPNGPYSQAIRAGQFLFVAGQIPIDPKTGKLVGDTFEMQMKQVLANIEAILNANHLTFEHVVKTEVFLKDMQDVVQMNAIYTEKFCHEIKPARQTIQAAKLPMDVRVEISCIAFLD
jgi:2-iminobutanoate/2-iminopropanoate deaminase